MIIVLTHEQSVKYFINMKIKSNQINYKIKIFNGNS